MSKVYLLLRNNKQSGPHSLEELLKLGLKPLDLIWVEGKSYGWSYPSEISALKSHVATPADTTSLQTSEKKYEPQVANKVDDHASYLPTENPTSSISDAAYKPKVYVSMPVSSRRPVEPQPPVKQEEPENNADDMADKIEQKAEELRKRIQSYTPDQKPVTKTEEPVITKYSSTLPEREEAYTSWIYNQKGKKSNGFTEEIQKRWGSIVVAALLIFIVGYGISQYKDDKTEVELAASTEVSKNDKTVPPPLIPESDPTTVKPVTENNIAYSNPESNDVRSNDVRSNVDRSNDVRSNVVREKKEVKNNVVADKKKVIENHKVNTPVEGGKKSPVIKNSPKEIAPPKVAETKVPEVKAEAKKESEPLVTTTAKKKKTLNEKVDAFFSKFAHKTKDPAIVETSQPAPIVNSNTPATTNPGAAERKATHRDDKSVVTTAPSPVAAPTVTNLAEYVELTSNKPSETWMLGVHGMKVSLHNTSNEIVKTAQVELRYYTEQNEVLEKKIVNFNNILPGKTVTLPAPDHRLADHADFRLVTAK